jgi:hypothetical protein
MLFDVEATQTMDNLSHLGRVAWTFGGQSGCLSIVTTRVTEGWEYVGHLESHGKTLQWVV